MQKKKYSICWGNRQAGFIYTLYRNDTLIVHSRSGMVYILHVISISLFKYKFLLFFVSIKGSKLKQKTKPIYIEKRFLIGYR